MNSRTAFVAVLLCVLGPASTSLADGAQDRVGWKAQYHRPEAIPFPPDNPYSDAKARLGRTLFFDPIFSGSGVRSCASCHNPARNGASFTEPSQCRMDTGPRLGREIRRSGERSVRTDSLPREHE